MEVQLIKAEDYGLKPETAQELTAPLQIVKDERNLLIQEFEQVSKLEVSEENLNVFRELRLKIAKNRTQGINKWHKTNKEFFLTGGKFIDAIKNKEKAINENMEARLYHAEKHFENLEKERIEKLQKERVELLSEFVDGASERNLSEMDGDVWDIFLATKKKAYFNRIKAEKEAEEKRQAEIKKQKEEQESIRKENERLKKKAEELEKKARREQARIDKIEADRQAKLNAERREIEEQQLKERKAHEMAIKKEREEREKSEAIERKKFKKLEAELLAKKKAEQKALEEAEKARQAELNKGDAAKVRDLLRDLDELQTKYTFKSKRNKKMYTDVSLLIDKVKNHINK